MSGHTDDLEFTGRPTRAEKRLHGGRTPMTMTLEVERAQDHHLGVVQTEVAQRAGRCQEVPLCDTHSKRSSARETRSQLHLHPVKSISTTHYGKKLGVGQEQRDQLLALDTDAWVRGVRPKIAWN
jgi:hypothetical protein